MTNNEIYESLTPNAKVDVDSRKKEINKEILQWVFFITIAIAILILCSFGMLMPSKESIGSWIQRSGSIVVALSLMAEFNLMSIQRFIPVQNYQYLFCDEYIKNKYDTKLRLMKLFTLSTIASGTIIWGYGDLIFK